MQTRAKNLKRPLEYRVTQREYESLCKCLSLYQNTNQLNSPRAIIQPLITGCCRVKAITIQEKSKYINGVYLLW